MSDRPDILPLYRVRPGSLISGGTYVAIPLSSDRLQVIEVAPTYVPRADVAYYSPDPGRADPDPASCPRCDEVALCDCAEELDDELANADHAFRQLRQLLAGLRDLHPLCCDPGSGRLVCETCRVPYPCPTRSALQDVPDPAARLLVEGVRP